jgi:hypothetical protein
MPLSEAQIVGLYSQLYPSLLMYGAPILPTVHILKVASAEVWTDILYDFSSLLLGMYALTVKQIPSENLRIFDNNEVFAAAQMLSFCIGNAGPDELPLLLNDVFGEGSVMTQGGGKRKNFSFRNYFTNTSTSQKGGDRYNNMSNSQVETEFSTRGYGDGAGSESFTADQKRQFMRNMNRSRAAPSSASASASGSVLAPSRARPSNTLGNAQRNLGITAEVAAQLQRELQAPAAAAAVTNIVTRLSAGESLNLATLSPFNTSQQLAILHQIYQTVGTQRAMQMVARAAHCDALVAGGGAFSPAKVGEFVNKLRIELQKDNRIVQTLLEKFNEGKQLEKSDREGLSADASAILEQMTSLLQREETKMGLTKAIKEFKQKAVKHRKEFYDSLQMLGISAAATVVSWVAIDWASSGTEDQSNPLAGDPTTATINATTLASATLALNATATAAVAAADSVGWGAWLGGAAEGVISGAAYYVTKGIGRTAVKLVEGASSATQNLTGETPTSLLYGAASAMNPLRPFYWLQETAVVAAKPLAALTVGVTAAITVNRIGAFRRAEQNIQFADENLMRLIRTIQGQYLGQLWSGYLNQKEEMLSYIASVFGQTLSQAQITGLEAAGGVEALATRWETKFSAELQQSGMQQIINTLSPQEALALQEVINTELQTARGEVQRALTEYKQFLRQPLADQAWAGSHNVLVTCSATALGGIRTVTSGIMSAAQAGAAAAIAGGAGVAAVGASMLQQRANAENQALREQIQRLAAQRTAEEQEARRVANEAKRVANEATAAQARRVANNARRLEEEARRVANNARRASEARRVEEEARRVANNAVNNAALVPRNGAPMFVAGLAPALAAIPRLHMEQRELAILMRLYAEQQRERVALGNAPRGPRIEEIDGGGRRHVKRRSMTKKHRKHTKKTRKH